MRELSTREIEALDDLKVLQEQARLNTRELQHLNRLRDSKGAEAFLADLREQHDDLARKVEADPEDAASVDLKRKTQEAIDRLIDQDSREEELRTLRAENLRAAQARHRRTYFLIGRRKKIEKERADAEARRRAEFAARNDFAGLTTRRDAFRAEAEEWLLELEERARRTDSRSLHTVFRAWQRNVAMIQELLRRLPEFPEPQ